MDWYAAFLVALIVSLLLAVIIVSTQRIHGHLTLDSHAGVQKVHEHPTPRIGGIAVVAGAIAGGILLASSAQNLWGIIALSAIPAFVFGLMEDVTKRVSVKMRLIATIFAGLIFSVMTGFQINRVDIPGVDWALSFWLVALLFTGFAVGGIANAVNIIDGVNGLASGTSIIILIGFGIVALQVGDSDLAGICLLFAGALTGFFLLNFPTGKIFLGDAGAYATGFLLAVVAVALPARHPELSPLIGLLALSYPVTETLVSIHRRVVRQHSHPGQADRLHLHSLVYRSRARQIAGAIGMPGLRSAIAGLLLLALPMMSSALMIAFGRNSALTILGVIVVALVYIAVYRRVALLGKTRDARPTGLAAENLQNTP